MLVLSIVSFGKQNKGHNAFKCQIPIYSYKPNITNSTKHLPKWPYVYLINTLFGIFGGHYMVFSCFADRVYLFGNYCLVLFFFLQIKTSCFHLKEEGKELLGMLMAALANNNGYYVLYLFPLFFSKIVNCYFQN